MSIPAHHEEQPRVAQDTGKTPAHRLLDLHEHLRAAAAVAAELDVDLDAFMRSAWQAYMDARPGLQQHLEDLQLAARLEEMRQAGRVGEA